MIYFYIFLYLIVSFLTLYNINTIVSLITNSKLKFSFSFISFIYIICSAIRIFCYISYSYPTIDFILLLLSYVLLILGIYKIYSFCKPTTIIYISVLYLSLDSLINSVLKFIYSMFYENYDHWLVKLTISTLCSVTLLIINNIIKLKINKLYFQTGSIPQYIYILILFVIFSSGGLIENQMMVANEHLIFQNTFNKFITIIVIVLLIVIIMALVFICTLKSHFENTSLLLEKLNYSQAEYYQNIIKLNEDQRKFRHDYRNHMFCIQALIKEKQYSDAEQYIQEITHKDIIEGNNFFTGNQIADAILYDKSVIAKKINTEIQFEGSICDKLPLSDVCVIFANTLDNAIEACEKITNPEKKKKIIMINCLFTQNMQIIQISNPVENDIEIYNNAIETTKEDKFSHGIGLHNIMRTVEKYHGECSISCENKRFVIDIGFQINNIEDKQPALSYELNQFMQTVQKSPMVK